MPSCLAPSFGDDGAALLLGKPRERMHEAPTINIPGGTGLRHSDHEGSLHRLASKSHENRGCELAACWSGATLLDPPPVRSAFVRAVLRARQHHDARSSFQRDPSRRAAGHEPRLMGACHGRFPLADHGDPRGCPQKLPPAMSTRMPARRPNRPQFMLDVAI
jgi:hypothetical protein